MLTTSLFVLHPQCVVAQISRLILVYDKRMRSRICKISKFIALPTFEFLISMDTNLKEFFPRGFPAEGFTYTQLPCNHAHDMLCIQGDFLRKYYYVVRHGDKYMATWAR